MLTTFRLYGKLGREFGRVWELDVSTPKEGFDAINELKPGFHAAIANMMGRYQFGVTVGGRKPRNQISEERLNFPNAGKTVTLTPVLSTSGGKTAGWIQLIAGIVLIAAAVFVPALEPFAIQIALAGAAIALGGITQLLSPTPSFQTPSDSKTRPSYQFSNIVNSTAIGECVPVCYGGHEETGMWIGSAVGSAGYENVDITQGSTQPGTSNLGGGFAAVPIEHVGHPLDEP